MSFILIVAMATLNRLLKVRVLEGTDLPKGDADSSDPYVRVRSRDAAEQGFVPKEQRTTVILKNFQNPIWDETMYFLASDGAFALEFEVVDFDLYSADDSLAVGLVEIHQDKLGRNPQRITIKLDRGGELVVELSLLLLNVTEEVAGHRQEVLPDEFYAWLKHKHAVEIGLSSVALRDPLQLVYVFLHSAEAVKIGDHNTQSSDPYVEIHFIGKYDAKTHRRKDPIVYPKNRKSKVIEQNLHPEWRQGWYFLVKSCDCIQFILKDMDLGGQDDLLGTIEVHLDHHGRMKKKFDTQGSMKFYVGALPCRGIL